MKIASCTRGLVVVLALGAFSIVARAAETVHLFLTLGGKPVQGESTQTSLGRENSIECVHFDHQASMAGEKKSYAPVTIRKRIDKSSPLLMKALATNQEGEAVFKFFRPNPAGDGTTQQFYTVTLKGVRIASVHQFVPNAMDPASSNYPPQEDVAFVFKSINWTFTSPSVSFEDRYESTAPVRSPAPLPR